MLARLLYTAIFICLLDSVCISLLWWELVSGDFLKIIFRDLMVASNKKSIDEHIALLKWPSAHDDEKTVTYLEMLEDKYSPRIDLQGESYPMKHGFYDMLLLLFENEV